LAKPKPWLNSVGSAPFETIVDALSNCSESGSTLRTSFVVEKNLALCMGFDEFNDKCFILITRNVGSKRTRHNRTRYIIRNIFQGKTKYFSYFNFFSCLLLSS
jgi:hypothetical protein